MLYVVATPIGNLDDLSKRAIDTLARADIVAAEDTRRSRQLLTHFGIAKKTLVAMHAHSKDAEIEKLVEKMKEGSSVALVTDAGTPSVSDPGDALVRAAIDAGIRVVPIPGPSAVVAALSASGLAEHRFRFFGFLPRQNPERAQAIDDISKTSEPCVLYESPERTNETLSELARATPSRTVCIARELTKMHEELVRGALQDIGSREWIGEITIVLGAFSREEEAISDEAIDARIDEELRAGGHAKTIAQRVAAWSNRPQRDVYARVIARKR